MIENLLTAMVLSKFRWRVRLFGTENDFSRKMNAA
jgi:hypothetical protein